MISILRSNLVRSSAMILSAAVFVACGGSTEPKVPPRDNVPATVTSTTTGTLSGQAGSTLNTLLSVVVKNKAGQGADSALVTFTVTSGGGSVSNTTVRTDTTGVASTTWTLGGTAGTQTVTATVGTLAPVTFTATASATLATTLTKGVGDNQTAVVGANVAIPPSVKVTDKFGNPVQNVLVNFSANNGGSVSGASVSTDVNGVATVGSWKLGPTVGTNTLTATVPGISTPVTFTATGTVGAISRVTITSAAIPTLTVGQTATVTASAFDASNNRITNPTFTYSSDNTAVATVNSAGLVTAVGAGSATISVTANGISATTPVSVIGHPGITVAATLPMTARIRNLVVANGNAYVALSAAQTLAAVSSSTNTVLWTGPQYGAQILDVGVSSSGTAQTALGQNQKLFFIDATSHAPIDSLDLPAVPVKMVENSTGTRVLVDMNNFNVAIVDVATRQILSLTAVAGTMNVFKMGPGDSVAYAAMALGNVVEINTATGAVKRQFQPTAAAVQDFAISRDGKTMYVVDGSSVVTIIPLAAGGRSGTADFGVGSLSSVAIAPDDNTLYVTQGNQLIKADRSGSEWITGLVDNRITVAGTVLKGLAITATGNAIFAIDDAGNQVVIFK